MGGGRRLSRSPARAAGHTTSVVSPTRSSTAGRS